MTDPVEESDLPLPTKKPQGSQYANPEYVNLCGYRFGQFRVIGLSLDKAGHWVVKCACGRYATRRTKAVLNENNRNDRCKRCQEIVLELKRQAYQRKVASYRQSVDVLPFAAMLESGDQR
jgi:hypothetical protein